MVKGKLFESSSSKANKSKKRNYSKNSWHQCQCSGSNQIPSQDHLNDYHQFLSLYTLYTVNSNPYRTELVIYNTENKNEERKFLNTELIDYFTSITQLPNGELFLYGTPISGRTSIIDMSFRIRMLPPGTPCQYSSVLYFNNNIYCFGGFNNDHNPLALSRKFDLEKYRWNNLTPLPEPGFYCHSVIFNKNILVSRYFCKNLWLYSIEIDSFSTIPYEFQLDKIKLLINVEQLYLIEWDDNGFIYEGEDEYNWKPISKTGKLIKNDPKYCLYNKEKIYISTWYNYYQFDLKEKVVFRIT